MIAVWLGTRTLPVCTPRALVLSFLGGPRTARLGQTWLRPWSGLSQQNNLSLSCLFFNKHTVHKCLCNNYIQLIRSSEIKIEHSSVRVKIAKRLFSLPCYTFLESRKALMLINRDVLVVFNNVYLNLLLCPVQKNYCSDEKTALNIDGWVLWLFRKTSRHHHMEVTLLFTKSKENN